MTIAKSGGNARSLPRGWAGAAVLFGTGGVGFVVADDLVLPVGDVAGAAGAVDGDASRDLGFEIRAFFCVGGEVF